LLRLPGWWRRPTRLFDQCREEERPSGIFDPAVGSAGVTVQPLLVIGSGCLGHAFGQLCVLRGIPYVIAHRGRFDIEDLQSIDAGLEQIRPWAVVNAAGYTAVDDAERDLDRCDRENRLGAQNLATACAQRGLQLVTFSSDLVFDGLQGRPYVETDRIAPVNAYGRSKACAEAAVVALHPKALIVRSSAFFGPWDTRNFLTDALARLLKGAVVRVADDEIVSPTYLPDLVNACLDLLLDRESGIWHLNNVGALSWADFAVVGAKYAGVSKAGLVSLPSGQMGRPAVRPPYSVLTSGRGILLPALEDALRRYTKAGTWREACAA